MRTRQLSDLILDVRKLTGTESATTFIPDADITELLNQGWTRVYGVYAASGENYFLSESTFSTVAGQPTYATTAATGPAGTNVLPLDLWDVKGVDVLETNGFYRAAHRLEFERRNDFQLAAGASWGWPSRKFYDYRQMGNAAGLTLYPTPDIVTTVNLWYFPAAVRLVNSTDTWDGGNGWERWAIAIAARWVAIKDENYDLVQSLEREIASWEVAVKAEAQNRNTEEAPRMRRSRYVRRRGAGWPFPWGDGGW